MDNSPRSVSGCWHAERRCTTHDDVRIFAEHLCNTTVVNSSVLCALRHCVMLLLHVRHVEYVLFNCDYTLHTSTCAVFCVWYFFLLLLQKLL